MQDKKYISKKVMVLLLVVMLLLGGAIGGTLAWLFDQTEPVMNTFTVGNVDITLNEHVLDKETGKQVTPEAFTTSGNKDVKLVPGRVIDKDPTVTVLKGSEKCYVRVLMKVFWSPAADSQFNQFAYRDWFTFNNVWSMTRLYDGTYATNGKYVGYDIYDFRYTGNDGVVDASKGDVTLPLFSQMTVPLSLDNEKMTSLEDCGVELIAQAIQKESFTSADSAWASVELPYTIPEKVNP